MRGNLFINLTPIMSPLPPPLCRRGLFKWLRRVPVAGQGISPTVTAEHFSGSRSARLDPTACALPARNWSYPAAALAATITELVQLGPVIL